jgi:hypothetical protein
VWLPDQVQPATHYSTQAVESYRDRAGPEWSFGDQAGSHADLAIARIIGGEVEGARLALDPVLDLPADQRINGVIASTQRVHRMLAEGDHGAVGTELRDAIESFGRVPVAALSR